jgi:hypothetical protein
VEKITGKNTGKGTKNKKYEEKVREKIRETNSRGGGAKVRELRKAGQGLFRSREFVTSGEKGPTRADIAQLPVVYAQNILPNRASSGHVTDVTSGHAQWSDLPRSPSNVA